MAKKLKATKIQEAIRKAQRVGETEERFTIDGCDIVLRSLQAPELSAILEEIDDVSEIESANAYRVGHLCRSIVELNGESLRDADFIEVDIVENDEPKTITLERHKFIADYVLSTWSEEAIKSAYRKFNDVTDKAEALAVEGVEFRLPDETPEEKFKRLLVEAKDLEGHINFELANRILQEVGYLSKTSKEELDSIDQKLSKVSVEPSTEDTQEAQGVETPMAPRAVRVPLNQVAIAPPVPMAPVVTRAEPPEEVVSRPVALPPEVVRRSRELEAIESDPVSLGGPPIQSSTRIAESVPGVSSGPVSGVPGAGATKIVDPNALSTILNRTHTGGINSRYRPPQR